MQKSTFSSPYHRYGAGLISWWAAPERGEENRGEEKVGAHNIVSDGGFLHAHVWAASAGYGICLNKWNELESLQEEIILQVAHLIISESLRGQID